MNKYEVLYIIVNEIEDEAKAELIEKFKSTVENLGGVVESVLSKKEEGWGTRKYAYEINHKTEGFYVLMTFSADPTVPRELERIMKITENIVRCMVIRL